MKSKYYSISRFFLIFTFISAVSIGTAVAGAAGHWGTRPGGQLLVLRPANFGWNVAFSLEIDGRPVGTFVQGRYYHGMVASRAACLNRAQVTTHRVNRAHFDNSERPAGVDLCIYCVWDSDFVYLRPSGCVPDSRGVCGKMGWPGKLFLRQVIRL